MAALEDGRPVGSNFLWHTDAVAGVGPITVDPAFQGRKIGRALMEAVLQYARREGIEISFVEYLKVGLPVTIITLAIDIAWMQFFR